jgi:hypothetical protein
MTPGRNAAQAGWRWTLLAAAVGLLSSLIFSTVLRLPRGLFVACWTITASAFLVWYVVSQNIDMRTQLQRRWVAGLVVGVMLGALLARQVLGQPGSLRAEGLTLAGELLAFGVVYGVVDALMLSVLPVLSLYGMRSANELREPGARYKWAFVALVGSGIVSAAYHAGFAEFRGPQLVEPVIGNVLITLSYLLTGSPVAPIVSHVLMHAAAVMHGMATTVQLPPHY